MAEANQAAFLRTSLSSMTLSHKLSSKLTTPGPPGHDSVMDTLWTAEVRRQIGATHVSDEGFLLRVFASEEAVKALPDDGRPREYLNAGTPLVRLVGELTRQDKANHTYIRKPDISLTLGRA